MANHPVLQIHGITCHPASRVEFFSSLLALAQLFLHGWISATAAQVGLVEIGAGTIAVNKLLEKFEDGANRLVQNGATTGDALMTKFDNELHVATSNLEIALQDQQTAFFKNLAPPEQEAITQLNDIISTANQAVGQAATIAEVANLNLIELTNRTPFTSKVRFYISSLQGLSQTYSPADYKILIRGLGVGFAPGDEKYQLAFKIGNKDLPDNALQRLSATDLTITIPHDVLEQFFAEDKNVQVTAELRSTITAPRGCFFCITRTETKTYPVQFTLTLLAKHGVEITGVETIDTVAPSNDVQTTTVTVHNQGCKTDKPCNWTRTVTLADDEVAVGVRFSHAGPGCAWDYSLRSPGYGPDYDITGRQVVVYRHNDGEQPCDDVYFIDYKKLTHRSVETPLAFSRFDFQAALSTVNLDDSHAVPSKTISSELSDIISLVKDLSKFVDAPSPGHTIKIGFNQSVSIATNPANTSCAYRITAKYITKQVAYIDQSLPQSADGLLARTGAAREGDHCRVNIVAKAP